MNKKIVLFSALMISATQSILTFSDNQPAHIISQKQDGSLNKPKPVEPAQCHHQVDPITIMEQYFHQKLSRCGYSQDCIKEIRTRHSDELPTIDQVLEQEYMRQYRAATSNMSQEEQIKTLNHLQLHLILSDSAIAKGQEGPALMRTEDGSDRGGLGLRMQALVKVKKEIESAQK